MNQWLKRISVLAISLALLPLSLSGQTVTVHGTVVDSNNEPLPGVNVYEEGTQNGVSTDLDGHYSITVKNGQSKVNFNCLGFQAEVFKASELSAVKRVVLKEDALMLDDAVAIGYGSVKKEDLTGSVSAIKAEGINRGVVTSADDLLKGKMTGVQIIPGGGGPGSSGTIRIRGAASLNASNDPLIVIDGVPMAHSSLSILNPNDIESFSVLKDASAAAIYGSRASNGVVLVTTKKGQAGQPLRISYNGSISMNTNPSRIDVMDADEFSATIREYYPEAAAKFIGNAKTDWQDLVLQTAYTSDHNLSISGSVKKMPYRASLGFLKEEGTIIGSWRNRGSGSVSLTPSLLDDHLKISLNGRINLSDGYSAHVLYSAAFFNPTMPPYFYNADGSIDYSTTGGYFNYGMGRGADFVPDSQAGINGAANPLESIFSTDRKGLTTRMVGNATFDYKVHGFEDLRFNLNLAYEGRDSWSISGPKRGSLSALADSQAPGIGKYSDTKQYNYSKLLEFYADYNHDFNGHRVDLMAGYSYSHVFSHYYSESRFQDDYGEYKKDEIYGNPSLNDQEHFLISFYGRLNYSYKSRYLVTATLRNDASSRFSPETRWGLFPSMALAWNAKEEDFLKHSSIVSTLKARLGWGVTGQQDIGSNYPYLARYSMSTSESSMYDMGDKGLIYFLSPSAYDSLIKWEETVTTNAGIDFGFLGDRISGNIDIYKRETHDLLNTVTIPMGANFSNTLLTNVGSIENKGLEFALNLIPVSTRNWNVQMGLNGTFQSTRFTKLTSVDDPTYYIPTGQVGGVRFDFLQRHSVGNAPYTYYVYQQLYDNDGKPIQNAFVDRDGNGTINDNDRYMAVTADGKAIKPAPDFFYGITFKATWKNWDFGFNGHGSVGNWLFNDAYASHSTTNANINYNYIANYSRSVLRSGFHSSNITAQSFSDMFLENASFFRMDDINLGYTFKWRSQKSTIRIALSAQNVFVLTKYSGLDPEASGENGIDSSMWPRPRVYSLRAAINF